MAAFEDGRSFLQSRSNVKMTTVTANGKQIEARLPCSIEAFLVAQKLRPRSVVVERNGAYGVKRPPANRDG